MPYAVVACALMMSWAMGVRSSFFTVMPSLAADVGLTTGAAGVLIGAQSVGYCLAMWGVGFLPGRRKVRVLAGAALSVLLINAVALAPDASLLYPLAFLSGAGAGFYLPLGLSIVTEVSPPARRARDMSFHEVFATIGHLGGPAFVAATVALLTWRQTIISFSLLGVVACLGFAFLREPRQAARAQPMPPLRLDARLLASVVAFASSQVLTAGVISVMPLVMVNAWGVPLSEAASVVSLGRVASFGGVLLAALMGDRWGVANVARGFYGFGLACMLAMAALAYGTPFVGVYLLANAAGSGGIALMSVVLGQAFPGRAKERALSVTTGVAGLAGLAGMPVVFGFLAEHGLSSYIFLGTAAACLLVVYLIGFLNARRAPAPPLGGTLEY
ncbi:MAG: MFS transporter [Chloroflexi bacterium]|nr:MFS transporter [Chloroflexota bacterium]